jgi:predicted PurR-regulated permease PerM
MREVDDLSDETTPVAPRQNGNRNQSGFGDTLRPPRWIWRWTLGAIALWWAGVLASNAVKALHDIILIGVVSFLVACALEQPVTRLERRGLRRGLATMIVLLLVVIMLAATSIAGGALLVTQISSLTDSLPEMTRSIIDFANSVGIQISSDVPVDTVANRIEEMVRDNAGNFFLQGTMIAGQIAAGALLVFYLVADGPRLRRNVCSLFPQYRQQTILDIWTAAIEKAGGYLVVRIILSFLASITSWLFFTVAGVDYAIALAFWVGIVSQVVPAVGTYLAALLPLLVASGDGAGQVLAVLLFLVAYQQLENYLFSPRISRKVMQVHPAIGFFAAISGAVIAGAPGAIIAVPIVATAQAVISASLERHQLVENDLLTHTPPPARGTRRRKSSANTKSTVGKRDTSKPSNDKLPYAKRSPNKGPVVKNASKVLPATPRTQKSKTAANGNTKKSSKSVGAPGRSRSKPLNDD